MSQAAKILLLSNRNKRLQAIKKALKSDSGSEYEVIVVDNIGEALKSLSNDSFELLIMDHEFLSDDHLQAFGRINKDFPILPVLSMVGELNQLHTDDITMNPQIDLITLPESALPQISYLIKETLEKCRLQNRAAKRIYDSNADFEQYRILVENAREAILVVQDENVVFTNSFAEEILKKSVETESSPSFFDFIHRDDRSLVKTFYQRCLAKKDLMNECIFRGSRLGEEAFSWFEIRFSSINWKGKPAALIFLMDVSEKLQAEVTLREREKLYRMIIENQKEGIILVDLEEKILLCNPAAETILGVEPGILLKKNLRDFLDPEMREFIAQQTEERKSGAKGSYETEIVRPDGEKRRLLVTVNPWIDDKGKVVGAFGIFRDITERGKAEEEVLASRQMLQSILDTIPVRVFWKDRNLNYLGCNRLFAEDAGMMDPLEIVGKNDYSMTWKQEAESYRSDDKFVIASGKSKLNYEEPQTIGGEKLWRRTSKIPLTDTRGNVIGVLGTFEDITERKVAVRELEIQKAFMTELFEGSPEAIAILDNDDRVININREFTRLFGHSFEEAKGRQINDLIVPKELKEEGLAATNMVADGLRVNLETIRQTKRGENIHVSILAQPVKLHQNQLGVYGIYRDITDRKLAEEEKSLLEEQLRQSQKMESIGRLAGGVAHDFNNLLSVIILHAELLTKKLPEDDPIRKEIRLIMETGQRAADLTSQLLAFGRKQMLQMKVLDLNDEIVDVEKMLRRIIREDIELTTKLNPEAGNIKADPAQINQILVNLSVNASDAMPEGGKLTLETENVKIFEEEIISPSDIKPGKYVMIKVTDNGFGMTEDTLEHIFEPFFTTKEIGKGTGLGLSTVYGIVKQHNGAIRAESEVGKGTAFKVYFPLVEEKAVKEAVVLRGAEYNGGTETILIVEDEDTVRMLINDILDEFGYKLIVAASPNEALDIVNQYEGVIDLLLSDIIMPKMNGKELYLKLKPRYPAMRSLFISGYTENVIAEQNIIEPGTHFLQKPFSVNSLTAKVREVLEI